MYTKESIAFIAAAIAVISALASWFALVITVNSNRVTLLRQAEADWNNVRKNYREQFWSSIENAYSHFLQSRRNVPADITNLIYSAYMPPSVPIKKSEHLRDWYVNHGGEINSDQREIWSFVTSIYPPKPPGAKKVTDGSIVEEIERDFFHDSRWEMSRFFQRNSKSLGKRKLEALTGHADRDVMLLSWLEVALIQSTRDNKSGGKESLFQFAEYLTSKRAKKSVK